MLRILAICSCGSTFYCTDNGIERMNNHINEGNYKVHQWVQVPDLVMSQEVEEKEE